MLPEFFLLTVSNLWVCNYFPLSAAMTHGSCTRHMKLACTPGRIKPWRVPSFCIEDVILNVFLEVAQFNVATLSRLINNACRRMRTNRPWPGSYETKNVWWVENLLIAVEIVISQDRPWTDALHFAEATSATLFYSNRTEARRASIRSNYTISNRSFLPVTALWLLLLQPQERKIV